MASKKRNEVTAGIFVFASIAVLLGVVLWLGAAEWFKPTRQQAFFFARESAGKFDLGKGSFVKINDAEVGKIEEVRRAPELGGTLYVARIEQEDVKVYADGKATVVAGLVGGADLVITSRGTEAKGLADKDGAIEIAGGLGQAMGDIATAAEKLREIAETMAQEFDAENKEGALTSVKSILQKVDAAAADVAEISATVRGELDREQDGTLAAKVHKTVDDAGKTASHIARETDAAQEGSLVAKVHTGVDDLDEIVADAKPKVSDALRSITNATKKIEGYTDKEFAEIFVRVRDIGNVITKVASDLKETMGTVKQVVALNRENVDEMVDNLVLVSANLKATSKEIRRNPWRLLYEPDDKELRSADIAAAARAYSDGATELDQAITKLKALQRVPGDDPQLKEAVQAVRKHLQRSFANLKKVEDALWEELKD